MGLAGQSDRGDKGVREIFFVKIVQIGALWVPF